MRDANKKYQDLERKYISLLKQHVLYLEKYGELQNTCIDSNNLCIEYKNKYEAMGTFCMKLYEELSDLKGTNKWRINQKIISTICEFTDSGYSIQDITDILTNAKVSISYEAVKKYVNQYKECKLAKNDSEIEHIVLKHNPNVSKEKIRELIALYKIELSV